MVLKLERGEKLNPWDGRIGGAFYGGTLFITNTLASMVINLVLGVILTALGMAAGSSSGALSAEVSAVGMTGNLVWNLIVGVAVLIPAAAIGLIAGWIAESRYGTAKAKP